MAVLANDRIEEIKAYIEARDLGPVKAILAALHPSDIAHVLNALSGEEAVSAFRLLAPDIASEVLLEVDEGLREVLIAEIGHPHLVRVVDEMETDDAADVISELSDEEAKKVLQGIDWHESLEVKKLLGYPEDTAGGKMQAELVSVHEDSTVEETIADVRKKGAGMENISSVFVVNGQGELVGAVGLDRLILARPDDRIISIADRNPVKVSTGVDQEEVARLFQRYNLITMPVVDSAGKLVGRITVDDVVDVIEDEIFEDFYRLASLNVGDRATGTFNRSFRMRSPWLLLNLVTAFAAASVVKLFEATIESFVILAVLMPIVAGVGGNAATQTIAVVIRGLALGEVGLKNARRILGKEALVGLANGLVVGVVAGLASYLLGSNLMIGVLLFMAMTANLMIAGLCGSTIPLVLKWFNVDPALSTSIFVTACTDVVGFFTFLGLATVFMKLGLI